MVKRPELERSSQPFFSLGSSTLGFSGAIHGPRRLAVPKVFVMVKLVGGGTHDRFDGRHVIGHATFLIAPLSIHHLAKRRPHVAVVPKVDRHFLRPCRRARPSRNAILEVRLIGGGGEVAVLFSRTIQPSRNATSVQPPVGTPSCRSSFSRTVLRAFAFARPCSVAAASLTAAPRLRNFR
jgi:hypothetical protein